MTVSLAKDPPPPMIDAATRAWLDRMSERFRGAGWAEQRISEEIARRLGARPSRAQVAGRIRVRADDLGAAGVDAVGHAAPDQDAMPPYGAVALAVQLREGMSVAVAVAQLEEVVRYACRLDPAGAHGAGVEWVYRCQPRH